MSSFVSFAVRRIHLQLNVIYTRHFRPVSNSREVSCKFEFSIRSVVRWIEKPTDLWILWKKNHRPGTDFCVNCLPLRSSSFSVSIPWQRLWNWLFFLTMLFDISSFSRSSLRLFTLFQINYTYLVFRIESVMCHKKNEHARDNLTYLCVVM